MAAFLTWGLASVLGGSFAVCALLVLTQRWHGKLSLDHDLNGAQKLHAEPVPRVGGLGLLFGLIIAVVAGYLNGAKTYPTTLILLACAMPVFLAGFAEDLTKRVRVRTRLLASFVSAAAAAWLLDARLLSLDTVVLDTLVSYPAISVLFTVFAVGGVIHSINIIDGLNGLAAGAVSIMLAGLAALAWTHGDFMVMKLCLWGIAAMMGFLLLNYPFGRIFLGDGGAYLAGFWVAECGVLLLVRNPHVSTWAVLLTCLYPVWETVYSMYRRRIVERIHTGQPDSEHLHQLFYKSQRIKNHHQDNREWVSHGISSAFIWGMIFSCQIMALIAGNNTAKLIFCIVFFVICYCWLYRTFASKVDDSIETISATKVQTLSNGMLAPPHNP